ncbi:MAG: ATP-dependent DNA helicase RecG [Candidatus Peribacteraceae bacterium]|nr:ATP-dependent DNA helicase RecG [Candidatus Peribacteraceae bacterium]
MPRNASVNRARTATKDNRCTGPKRENRGCIPGVYPSVFSRRNCCPRYDRRYTAPVQLSTPLAAVLRTTKDHLRALEGIGLRTVQDLLLYFPRAHEDLSAMHTIATAGLDEKVTIRGTLHHIKLVRIRGGKQLVTAKFQDAEGDSVDVVWFNQPHVKRMIEEGGDVVLTGKIVEKGSKLQFQSPQFEKEGAKPLIHAGRLVPIYPQHEIINTKWLREKMMLARDAIDLLPETLPQEVVDEEHLVSRKDMVRFLHFPDRPEDVAGAYDRLAFEQMYDLQREALERKREWQGTHQKRLRTPMDIELIRALFASLHFTPTNSQKIAIYEILRDMEKDVPMSRLLEGDVGSGKTLVAASVMANTVRHGGQCALMVPTEVLARQHAESLSRLLLHFHTYLQQQQHPVAAAFRQPVVTLLTGSTPRAEADAIKRNLASGLTDIVIGTHALIEDTVRFTDLRLVIVDEQHRFGVMQRERLREKGSPHFLSMTATPIPRTLALTAYGDHDLSVLLEKPGRRQAIDTKVVAPGDRKVIELFIDHQIREGRQVFVICPLITESEELDEVRNVEQEAKRLRAAFPRRRIAMLHGKLPPPEKQEIMRAFRDKASDILVSTSVIEVGIDVPNATIILIEGAERFGLAQLHQLRGRVGRGDHKSYCFLFTTQQTQASSPRLRAMEQYDSGFMLAEMDLRLRGPGEIFGTRQSGIPDSFMRSLLKPELIARARRAAERVLSPEGKKLESVL